MGSRGPLLVASVLSILFTVALFYATVEVPRLVNDCVVTSSLSGVNASEIIYSPNISGVLGSLRPLGYAAFALTAVLAVLGFLLRKSRLALTGSWLLYLPTFGYFAFSMVWLAGIGAVRVLWLPLLDASPATLKLGHIVLVPYLLLSPVLKPVAERLGEVAVYLGLPTPLQELLSSPAGLIALTCMVAGIFMFTFGTATWFYGRFRGFKLVDFWAYKISRHPQYLGFLLWSYGLTLAPLWLWPPRGITLPTPTLPWLLSALTVVSVALWEEAEMVRRQDINYLRYRESTPFMFPLPKPFSELFTRINTWIIGKPYPETLGEVLIIVSVYGFALVLLSIPLIPVVR